MKKIFIIIGGILLLAIAAAALFFLDLQRFAAKPADLDPSPRLVWVPPGQGFKLTAAQLYETHLIRHRLKFELLARIKGFDQRIKAGEYLLAASMTPLEILDMMASGKIYLHRLTVPEGFSMRQIATNIAEANLGDAAAFLEAAKDTTVLREKGVAAATLEGYLFPDTYYFARDVTPQKIAATMVSRFWSIFTPEWIKRAENLGLSIHEIVTLGSIIEKETGVAEERPVISSVFHNRLKHGMRLESDPTVIYGIEDFDGNIKRKHLQTQTPYNTYKIKGLPPGPIASPGREALKAALYPAETKFLYFVARKDRTHFFSTNFKEHNKAVRQYQLGR